MANNPIPPAVVPIRGTAAWTRARLEDAKRLYVRGLIDLPEFERRVEVELRAAA